MNSFFKSLAEKFQKVKEDLAQARIVGEAGAGMVRVTANGQREIVDVQIDPDLMTPENRVMVQDLVLAACTDAQRKADLHAAQQLGPLTGGLPIPPGLFS